MMRIDVTRMPASDGQAWLSAWACSPGSSRAAGCSDSARRPTRSDDPKLLKASMQKSMEIYKSKSQAKKGNPAAAKTRP